MDNRLVGMAQLTSSGTAVFKFRPGVGGHSYKAVFVGTKSMAPSASSTKALTVTGLHASITSIEQSGGPGKYTLTATVAGFGDAAPTGTVSILDIDNGNAVLGSATLHAGVANPGFVDAGTISTPRELATLASAVGDFNGDGIPDVAVTQIANGDAGTIVVLLGNGDGTFTASDQSLRVGTDPLSIAAGDFNSDGILDLAVANALDHTVMVLLGNGNGTFTMKSTTSIKGRYPAYIAVGDFNGDGIPDLATADGNSSTVTVLLGNGDGTFAPGVETPLASLFPASIAVADFNGDGIQDMAVADGTGAITMLLGKGDGTFTSSATDLADGFSPTSVAAGDFNGDGIPDLAVASWDNPQEVGRVTVLIGKGDGTFSEEQTFATGADPMTILARGFDGDGFLDLAVLNYLSDYLTVLLGNGDATFTEFLDGPSVDIQSFSMVSGDFNGDGLPDLAVVNGANSVKTLLANPNQAATAVVSGISAAGLASAHVVASFPGDSRYDRSVSEPIKLTALLAPTVKLTALPNPVAYGALATLTATVTGNGATSTGTVSFFDGETQLATATLNGGGVAALSTSSFGTGLHPITANYSGDSNYCSATSAAASLIVDAPAKATPMLSWPPPAAVNYGTPLSATQLDANAINAIGLLLAGTFDYSPAAGTVLPVGTNTLSLTFTPADTTDYTTATASVQLTVIQRPATVSWPTPAAVIYGTQLTATQLDATATVAGTLAYTPPAGTVPGAGVHSLSVTFTPSNTTLYSPVTLTVHLTVNPAVLKVAANDASRVYGTANPALTAAITGFVNGDSAAAVSGAPLLATAATVSSPAGQYAITAALGSLSAANYTFAFSNGILTVTKASQTISFPSVPTQVAGTDLILAATASSGLEVLFTSFTPLVCTVSGSWALLISGGTCGITASQSGNVDYLAVTPAVVQRFNILPSTESMTQTIVFAPIPAQVAATTIDLTATASSGLPVSFQSASPLVCAVSGASASLVASGFCAIQAWQGGNNKYFAAPMVALEFGVAHAIQTISFAPIAAQTVGASVTLTATASSGLAVRFASLTPAICSVSGATASMNAAGVCTIQATQSGNNVYLGVAPVDQSFAVTAP
jgi:hypothetical protein